MDRTQGIERREFLVRFSLLTAGAAATLAPHRLTAAPNNMTELTATAAVEAMRNGDMKAEDYARALLDRAQAVANLNAFRTLDRDMVLQAAQSVDKARASRTPARDAARATHPREGQRQHQGPSYVERHACIARLQG